MQPRQIGKLDCKILQQFELGAVDDPLHQLDGDLSCGFGVGVERTEGALGVGA
jgi:hypothetical protein